MWQVGSACYGTQLEAVGAIASSVAGSVHSTAAGLYSLDVATYDATSIEYAFTPLDGGPAIANVLVPVSPPLCGLLTQGDALELGWAVVAAWAAVFAIKFLARPFVHAQGDLNGNA